MRQSSGSARQVNTMGATLPQVSILLLGAVAALVTPCRSFVIPHESMNLHHLSSHNVTSSELMLSVIVNQMALLRMLNQTSNYWSARKFPLARVRIITRGEM